MREGWTRTRLAELLHRRTDRLGDASEPRILTVTEGHGLVDQMEHWGRRVATEDVSGYKVVDPGDVVYNIYLLWNGAIGQNLFGDRGVTSPVYEVFTPQGSVVARYLGLLLQEPKMVEAFDAISIGTIPRRRRAPWQDFLALPVSVPPVEVQKRIVDLVDALDAAIMAAEEATVALFAVIEQMRDVEMWNAPKRCPLSDLCAVDGSLVSPGGDNARLPHMGTERIVGGTGDLVGLVSAEEDGVTSGKYPYGAGHVVYSKIRPNLRKVALPDSEGLCSADAYPLLPSTDVPRRYLQQLLLSSPFTDAAVARSSRTKMPKINRAELMSILVPVHDVGTRLGFAERFDALDTARRLSSEKLVALRALRSALLTALMSGEHEIPASYDEVMEVKS